MRKQNLPKDKKEKAEAWLRISAVIKHYRYPSVSAFARDIGLNRGENLYQIKRGNNGISRELADVITSKFPEVSKAWLLTGEGTMNSSIKVTDEIPLFYRSPFNLGTDNPDRYITISPFMSGGAEVAVVLNSDSLSPKYQVGSTMLLKRYDPQNGFVFGDLYCVVTCRAFLYRIIRKGRGKNRLLLLPVNNTDYDEIEISYADISEVFKVCGVISLR